MSGNDHLLNIVMAFRATGLGEIRAAFNKEMEAIAAGAKGITSGTPEERRRQTRVGTEAALTDFERGVKTDSPHLMPQFQKELTDFRRGMSLGTKGFEGLSHAITQAEKQQLRGGIQQDQLVRMMGGQGYNPTPSGLLLPPAARPPGTPGGPAGPPSPPPTKVSPTTPDPADVFDTAQGKADSLAYSNSVRELLSNSKQYIAELVREKNLHLQLSTILNTELSVHKDYLTSVQLDANSKRRRSIAEQKALLKDPDYVRNVAADNSVTSRRVRREAIATQEMVTPKDIGEMANLKTLEAKTARAVELAELQNSLSNGTAKELAEIRALTEARKRTEQAHYRRKTANDIPAIAGSQFDDQLRQGAINAELAKLRDVNTPRGRTSAGQDAQTQIVEAQRTALIRRIVAEEQASSTAYLNTKAATRVAEKERADRIKAASLGVAGATDPKTNIEEVRARSAVAHRAKENERAAAAVRATTQADIEASVQSRMAQNRLDGAVRRLEKEYIKAALNRGELGGTGFQRLQSRFSNRGAAPEEMATLGQFVGQKALTAGAYTLVGTALYGSISAIKEMIKESEELDRVLNQVKAQFNGIGEGDEFGKFREDILAISRETGIAADKVAFVGFQFKGAFGTSEEAVKNLTAAMKITQVTGLSLEETVDSLTATSKTYGISIADIGDKAIGLEERFGVLSKQTITFTADIAAVAKQSGLEFDKVAALGAVAQQVSGRSGSALAESWGRVLPAIQDSSGEILSLYATLNNQGVKGVKSTDTISAALGAGETGKVIEYLIRDYDKLSRSQQNYLITLLGQRKESQALIPVFENSAKVVAEWDRVANGAETDTGKLGNRFRDLGETMHNTFQRAGEMWRQFGTALFELGLADIFVKAGNAAGALLAVITKIAQVVGLAFRIPLIGDFLGQLVQIGVLAFGVSKMYALMTIAIQAVSHAQTRAAATTARLTGATVAETGASTAATGAVGGQAAATDAMAAANARAAATQGAGTYGTAAGAAAAAAATRAQAIQNLERLRLASLPPPPILGRQSVLKPLASQANQFILPPGRLGGATQTPFPAGWHAPMAPPSPPTGGWKGLTSRGGAPSVGPGMAAAIAAAGAIAVVSKYMDERGEVEKTAMEFGEALKHADEGKLKAYVDSVDGIADESEISPFLAALGPAGLVANKLGTQFFGVTDPEIQAIQEYNNQQVAKSQAMFKALIAADKEKDTNRTEQVLKDVNKANQATVLAHFSSGDTKNSDVKELLEESFAGGDDGKKAFKELLKRAGENDLGAQEAVEFLGRVLKTQATYAGDVLNTADAASAAADRAKAAEAAGGEDQLSLLLVDSVKQLEKMGEVGAQTVLTKIEEEIKLHEGLRAEAEKSNNSIEAKKQIAVILQLKQDETTYRDLLRGRATELRGVIRAFAGLDDASAKLADIGVQLGDTSLTETQRLALNGPAVEALKAKFQEDVEGTTTHVNDAFERLELLRKGVDVPIPVQKGLAQQSFDAQQNEAVRGTAHVFGRDFQDTMDKVSGIVVERDVSLLQALDIMYDAQIKELEAKLSTQSGSLAPGEGAEFLAILERTKAAKDKVDKDLADNPGQNGGTWATMMAGLKDMRDAQFAALDREVSIAEAQAQLMTTQNTGNPLVQIAGEMAVAAAQLKAATEKKDVLAILNAQNAGAAAQRHALENSRDVTRAMLESAGGTGDPVTDTNSDIALARLTQQNAAADGSQQGVIRAGNEIKKLQRTQAENMGAIAQSVIDRQLANTRDPVAQVNLKIQAARQKLKLAIGPAARNAVFTEMDQLNLEQRDNMNAIADSALTNRIGAERDPFQQILLKIQLAKGKLARAEGGLAINEAQGELDQLSRDMADLFERAIQAKVGLALAVAEGKGDRIGAAKIQLNEAKRKLDKAVAEGRGGEEIANLQTELARQQAASADALMSSRTDDIDFMLEMGQITSRQAVAMLEALLNVPSIRENQERVRSIQRKIHSLNQELKQDLQFNLPTVDIQGLYYQANRVNQTRMAGQGYQDNRVISVNIPDAGNPAATAMAVAQVLGGGGGGGPQYTSGQRRYP